MKKYRKQCDDCHYQKSRGMCWAKLEIQGLYDITKRKCPDYKPKEEINDQDAKEIFNTEMARKLIRKRREANPKGEGKNVLLL